ncbi:MAG: DNA alkylation repair protein [Fluviicola sp.]|nr:MAG: DNA alkylation repair protein [Fluviicola sp.]
MFKNITTELESYSEPERVEKLKKYLQVFPGGYGEGDEFIGVRNPNLRTVSKKYYKPITLNDLSKLLSSNIHEYRLTGVFILVLKFEKEKSESIRKELVDFYVDHLEFMNNWDLIDSSAHKILGVYLLDKDTKMLYDFAYSDNLWLQRVSIISTFHFIRNLQFKDTFEISKILLHHEHDLIHKAVGWMIREVGNRDFDKAFEFVKYHYADMPRTMLRYAIEKYPEKTRQDFLKGRI